MAEPDWERARKWLMNEKVTKNSAKVPSLKNIKTEVELYNYLKDGTELCRMIGVVTKGTVLENITYRQIFSDFGHVCIFVLRTNNISTLEEKNIGLFLTHVATHDSLQLKRENVFKGQNEKVFHKFENFHIALAGLAMISAKLEKKIKVPKFEAKSKSTEKTSYDDIGNNDIYENGGGDEEMEIYDQQYSEQVYDAGNTAPQGLDNAVKELVDFNNSFINKVLENIKNNFESKPSTPLLQREFFAVFMIDDLLRLHKKLREKLEVVVLSYVEIGDVFEELKDDFLIYCKITAKMRAASEFLCNQMTDCEITKERIHNLEKDARRANNQLEDSGPSEIKDLIAMIPQHVMRYHMVLENIKKQASKAKGKKTEIQKEAKRAEEIMKNMTTHMDRVSRDYKYIEAMKEFKREIQNFPFQDLHRFGILKTELKEMLMATGIETSDFKPFNLLVFNEYIVALETVTRDEPTGKIDFWGVPITIKVEGKKYSKCFKIRDFDHIHTRAHGKEVHLFVNTIVNFNPDPERSFILKFHNQDDADALETEMKAYHKEAQEKIFFGSEHQDHECEKFRANGKMEDNINVRCGACGKLLEGLLFTAVHCKTCNKFYHKECFSVEKSEADQTNEPPEEFDSPEDYVIQKKNDLQLEDIDLGDISRKMIIAKLSRRRPGTFLLRYSKERKKYVLAVRNLQEDRSQNITQHVIKTVEINGETNYYIEKGTVAPSLLELIQKHRRSHFLYYPVANPDEEDEDEEEAQADAEVKEEAPRPRVQEMKSEEEEATLRSNLSEAHLRYFFGDIDSKQAGETLREEDVPGSFLLRKNGNNWKLSWLTFNGILTHSVLRQNQGMFCLSANQKAFPSIEEMVRHYQTFDHGNKMALGTPFLNPEMEESIARDKTPSVIDKGRKVSHMQGPAALPNYKGTMTEVEAERSLQKEPNESFLLRHDDKEELFISYKASHRTYQLRIEENKATETFYVHATDLGKIEDTSVRRLVDNLKDLEVFSSPQSPPPSMELPVFKPKSRVPPAIPNGPKGTKPRRGFSRDGATALPHSYNEEASYETDVNPPNFTTEEAYETDANPADPDRFPVIGKMENQRAARMLEGKANGTWILRLNKLGEHRITVVRSERPQHIKIFNSPTGGVTLRSGETPEPLNTIIERLIGQGTLHEQITKKTY